MSLLRQKVDAYLAGVEELQRAVDGMSAGQARQRPIPGKWSTLEVVAHLADFEPIHADRMKRVIAEDNPSLIGADETRFAAVLGYHDRDLGDEMALIALTRKQLARILEKQPEAVLERAGTHDERGRQTLDAILTVTTNHIRHHVPFIEAKRQALGLRK
jgi:uncharacterized damage-inducible protein DinB